MKVLLLGSGGREHAMTNALSRSPLLTQLYVAPGNPGTAQIATNVAINPRDIEKVISFCKETGIDFVIVGPEAPLVEGIVDQLRKINILAFGPSKAAAQLEGSKGFTKDFCREFAIPTADYARFSSLREAQDYISKKGAPIVIKADGLAAGKGVVVAQTLQEAQAALKDIFSGTYGKQSEVVIEEVLEGVEASFFALCDGAHALALGSAQDHKRAYDGDKGPNTGGMGAFSPSPLVDETCHKRIMEEIILPTIRGMQTRGTPFKGILFAGLMIGKKGPQLIEFNVRFGDPETQVILPRLQEDLLELCIKSVSGILPEEALKFSQETALTIVLAAENYPENPVLGSPITNVEALSAQPDVRLTHAGTRLENGKLVTAGGRVLNVTGLGPDLKEARARAYEAITQIHCEGSFYRKDIGGIE